MTNTLDTMDTETVLEVAISVAQEAGQLILSSYRRPHRVRRKASDVDLVTEVDLAAEELIRDRLNKSYPAFGILAEEGGETEGDVDARWIVDPLDGTTNFAHGHPFYCVSIALEQSGALVVGVIYAPSLGLTWSARRGGGTYRQTERTGVSAVSSLSNALCASGFPFDRWTAKDNNVHEWTAAVRNAQGVRRCGSAAIDLALIADGTYDGYWEKRLNPWDLAAGTLLVEEAGGRVTSLAGASVPPWPEVIVASNGKIHEELTALLQA